MKDQSDQRAHPQSEYKNLKNYKTAGNMETCGFEAMYMYYMLKHNQFSFLIHPD